MRFTYNGCFPYLNKFTGYRILDEATAKLFTASPKLLDALKELTDQIEEYLPDLKKWGVTPELVIKARQAIKEAI